LEAARSDHFGHCDCFTLVRVHDGVVIGSNIVDNPPHHEGGCLHTVTLLAAKGVKEVIVGGLGARPLSGLGEAGIRVFHDVDSPSVRKAVDALMAGQLTVMEPCMTCGGH
jgi:predicted Fe-Mo cluster-binding NifX family protein